MISKGDSPGGWTLRKRGPTLCKWMQMNFTRSEHIDLLDTRTSCPPFASRRMANKFLPWNLELIIPMPTIGSTHISPRAVSLPVGWRWTGERLRWQTTARRLSSTTNMHSNLHKHPHEWVFDITIHQPPEHDSLAYSRKFISKIETFAMNSRFLHRQHHRSDN